MFEIKVKYEKTLDEGVIKVVTENYGLDALSFTEAENRITDLLTPQISGTWKVCNIKRSTYNEVQVDEDGGYLYKARVLMLQLNESTGAIKTTPYSILFNAADLDAAVKRLKELLKGTMADYRSTGITEVNLMNYFK